MAKVKVKVQLEPVHAGVDVSKDELVVAFLRDESVVAEFSLANTPRGHQQLVKRLQKQGGCHRLVMEATSNFNLDLGFALDQAGLAVAVINPRQARSFADSLNRRAKTDKVDALVLAQAAVHLKTPLWVAPSRQELELRNIMRRISELTGRAVEELCRLSAQKAAKALGSEVQRSVARQIAHIKQEIAVLRKKALALVNCLPRLTQNLKLLRSMKGIGELTALKLLGELGCAPEGLSCRQWVAWAGLDPRPKDSGKRKGERRISRMGNKHLRTALYMSAVSATHSPGVIEDYYLQLIQRGKAPMVAICAAMRKMLHAIWGMLHHQQPFNPALFIGQKP